MTRRAAQYVRMSTDMQTFSIEYQKTANQAYAELHGYEIVRIFSDPGVSGLTFEHRKGLQALMAQVLAGAADYDVVLVYDVSRWGRFQDADEAAHYEFLCRTAGVRIEYTAEPFANDDGIASSLVKHLKRAMAAEYVRELSVKISRAKRGLAEGGHWQGGRPGYGLRRVVLRRNGVRRQLEAGEHNAVVGDRVTLVPGPQEERTAVARIFQLRAQGCSLQRIAGRLEAEGVPGPSDGRWRTATIGRMLQMEKYAGTNVLGRTRTDLGRSRREPPETWVRAPDAFEPIVSREVFEFVRPWPGRRRYGRPVLGPEQMLAALAEVLAERGRLSGEVIRRDPRTPCPQQYVKVFGSLTEAYARVGYTPTRQQRLAAERIRIHRPHLRRGRYAELWTAS